jgi:hypothetical protein
MDKPLPSEIQEFTSSKSHMHLLTTDIVSLSLLDGCSADNQCGRCIKSNNTYYVAIRSTYCVVERGMTSSCKHCKSNFRIFEGPARTLLARLGCFYWVSHFLDALHRQTDRQAMEFRSGLFTPPGKLLGMTFCLIGSFEIRKVPNHLLKSVLMSNVPRISRLSGSPFASVRPIIVLDPYTTPSGVPQRQSRAPWSKDSYCPSCYL